MGVLYDYFAARSDAAAAEMVTLQGDPGGPRPVSPGLREAIRAGDREAIRLATRPKVRMSDSGVLVLGTKGIDPLVQMGTLEALLTGEQYDLIVSRPRAGQQVAAEHSREGPWVVTLTEELQAALATATREQIVAVAALWWETEEFYGQGDPEILADFLLELADLARQACQRGERLYCWICL
jgi:hypothetical protein